MKTCLLYYVVPFVLNLEDREILELVRMNRMKGFVIAVLIAALFLLLIAFVLSAKSKQKRLRDLSLLLMNTMTNQNHDSEKGSVYNSENHSVSNSKDNARTVSNQQLQRNEAYRQLYASEIKQYFDELCRSNETLLVTEDKWQILSDEIEKHFPNFITQLSQVHKLSALEIRICYLLKLGVAPMQIARLLMRSPESISSSRRRMYEKFFNEKGSPKQWDEFIDLL